MTTAKTTGSIRRRMMWQMLTAAALLAGLLYYSIRVISEDAVEQTQDRVLGATTLAIAEEIRGGTENLEVDIPYFAFSMLGALGDDRIFYRILEQHKTITGYDDLPLPPQAPTGLSPVYYSANYQNEPIRIAAVSQSVLVAAEPIQVLILVAQTRNVQRSIAASLATRAAWFGVGFFALAAILALLTARSVLQPVSEVADAITRRGPQDLRPVVRAVPLELEPMVNTLNNFLARLSGALNRTETFIAEAAHYIGTPLTTLRTQSEIALRNSNDPEVSASLRKIIRLSDDTARSARQMLDHAAVIYRTDQRSDQKIDLTTIARDVMTSFEPAAELKDISIALSAPDNPLPVTIDPMLLEAVIRNLLDNAIKYSDPDSSVEIQLSKQDGFATFQTLDRGRGLDVPSGTQLEQRFTRGSNVADVVGSGLGLAIVRDVADAYEGQFSIRSRKKGGVCARFSLPLS